jgi:hypothetical protein
MSESESEADAREALPAVPVLGERVPDVAQILSYANPSGGGQPAHSRFVYKRHVDGTVTLTEPPDPRQSRGKRIVGMLVVLLALSWLVFVMIEQMKSGWRVAFPPGYFIPPFFLGFFGSLTWLEARYAARQPLVIEARPGVLTVQFRTLITSSRRRVFRGRLLGKITVPTGVPSVPSMRMYSGVYVVQTFGVAIPLVSNRPKDECDWIAGVLRRALAGEPGSIGETIVA